MELGQWKRAGWIPNNQEQNQKKEKPMRQLEEALQGPAEVPIIKRKGHDTLRVMIWQTGNPRKSPNIRKGNIW